MSNSITLILAAGVYGDSQSEVALNRGLEANTLDILERTKSSPSLRRQVLLTNSNRLQRVDDSRFPQLSIRRTTEDFHFGEDLFEEIRRNELERIFYLGAGSGSLLEENDFEDLFEFVRGGPERFISNNFYSTDFIGLSSANRLLDFTPPASDNELGWLSRDAGLTPYELKRSAKTQLDMDTPVDLLSLKLTEGTGGKLSDHVSSLGWGNSRIREILPQFTDQNCRLVIVGRIGASTWSHLEKEAACQIDVYSEGRGGAAREKEDNSNASLIGSLFEEKGPGGLINYLTPQGTGLFLDTRVLFDYLGEWPSRADRFSSDLLNPEGIATPYLKELTRAALESKKPVILGGHSMVSGSLYLFSDVSWRVTEPKSANIRPETYRLRSST